MKKKVLLIRMFHQNALTVSPPLGIGSLVQYVKERDTEYDFDLFDFCIQKNLSDYIDSKYKNKKPLIIGISTLLRHFYLTVLTANELKKTFPDVPIVVGGAGPSALMEMALENNSIDFVIYRDGEIGFYKLLKTISQGGSLADVPSLIYREKGKIKRNPPQIIDEEDIPPPDYEFIRLESYFKKSSHVMLGARKSYFITTTRGCPYGCIYCHNIYGKKVRYMPVEKVIQSFEKLNKIYKFDFVDIYDDIFNIDEERAIEIIKRISSINRDVKFVYPNGFRVDIMTNRFMDFIGENNTKFLSLAIESASPRLQKLIKKNIDINKAQENILYLSKYKIPIIVTFLFGLPTETLEELLQTIRFAFKLPITYSSFLRVVPHIGSEIFEMATDEQKKRILDSLKNGLHYHNVDVNLSNIPDKILNLFQRFTGMYYYLRPIQLYRVIRDTPTQGLLQGGRLISEIILGKAKE